MIVHFFQILEILSSNYLTTLDRKLEQLEASEQLVVQGYPYHYLSKVLHVSMVCLLRDIITTFKQGDSPILKFGTTVTV